MRKRFVIELGTGADLHGVDMTKAATRAVKDAISHSCLCALVDIYGRKDFKGVYVHVEVAVPDPAAVDKAAVMAAVPIGEKTINVVQGGLKVPGVEVPAFGPGCSDIVMACAALTVSIDE
ncbi:MAG: Lin0512 family protein [Desulfovibrio sp.]|jgi:uncharacterized protein (TIGR02058 family)|nr:Lin0512 family protein [Desulfovibrio sp.]